MKRIAFVVALLFLPAIVVVKDASDRRPICQRINSFITAHADSLPATLAALEAYPVNYRSRILNALSMDARTEIVLEHLERNRANITPELYAASLQAITTQDKDLAKDIAAWAIALYGKPAAAKIFNQVGGDPVPTRSVSAIRISLENSLRRLFAPVSAATRGTCHCAASSDWCNGGFNCNQNDWCDATSWGCGTFGLYSCNGLCEEACGPYDKRCGI